MMPQDRRLSVRKTPKHIGYLSLPRDNGGFVIDISEGGLGFQTIAPLNADGPIQIRFAIDSAERIRVFAELAWIDETRKAGGLRFLKLPDEARARIREWIGLPKETVVEAAPAAIAEQVIESAANPAVESIVGPAAQRVDESVGESPVEPLPESVAEPELACSVPADSAPSEALALAEPAMETPPTESVTEADADAEAPSAFSPLVEIDVSPSATAGNPVLPELPLAVYGGPAGKFSLFAAEMESESETTPIRASASLTMKHPVAAVALTVVLAFLTSVPISAYVSTSRAGDLLFSWSQRMWRAPASQTIRQAPAASTGDPAKLPPQ